MYNPAINTGGKGGWHGCAKSVHLVGSVAAILGLGAGIIIVKEVEKE